MWVNGTMATEVEVMMDVETTMEEDDGGGGTVKLALYIK